LRFFGLTRVTTKPDCRELSGDLGRDLRRTLLADADRAVRAFFGKRGFQFAAQLLDQGARRLAGVGRHGGLLFGARAARTAGQQGQGGQGQDGRFHRRSFKEMRISALCHQRGGGTPNFERSTGIDRSPRLASPCLESRVM